MIELFAESNNFGDTRDPGGLAGPTGLVVILLLAVGTILLIRNMNARLRRLPKSFDPPADRGGRAPSAEATGPAAEPVDTPRADAGPGGAQEAK